MPTNQTTNYQLSQWVKSDQVKMEDFNADNAKIDAALASHEATLASLTEAVPKLGNCAVYVGTYIGTGVNPVVQTFPGRPVFIVVQDSVNPFAIMASRGMETAFFTKGDNDGFTMVWGPRSVSWRGGSVIGRSLNSPDRPYFYMALLAMDEE